ncbi:WxL domain-containing protein [Enterococcus gallinarum]|uniref:WxL domain-containing protein n=1 Tax=Enterococcus gallinarum TaxID=1353 RepID=UPI0018A96694|nr:WxL domain-containing protein [Enterococcus gallinarum]
MKKILLTAGIVLISSAFLQTTAVAAEYTSNGAITFEADNDPTKPVDPTDPEKPVDPVDPTDPDGPNLGTAGPLSIDFASSFQFGNQKITSETMDYYAKLQEFTSGSAGPNYVQVTDNRGNNAGWRLTVKQNGQFKNENTLNQELTGSVIKLTEPAVKSNALGVTAPVPTETITLDASGSEAIVMTAAAQSGAGTWVNAWGAVETVRENDSNGQEVESAITKAISLTVPGNTPKDAVSYETTLTWTLSDTPGNEV